MTFRSSICIAALAFAFVHLSCNGSIEVPNPDANPPDTGPNDTGTGDSSGNCPGGCPSGQVCVGDECVATCSGGTGCDAPSECCGNACINVRTDPNNCGGCGDACAPTGDSCVGGICACNGAMACPSPQICCGADGCIDPTTNNRHCGGCNRPCEGDCAGSICETCAADPHEATGGNTCAAAEPLGNLVDNAADQLLVTGNLYPDGDLDCYWFTAQDEPDTTCDLFHVDIRFTDNPDNQFAIQVYRGSCEAPQCAGDPLDQFDWYTDFYGEIEAELRGECPCGATASVGTNLCTDNTTVFRFCVTRVSGDPIDCAWYEVEVSNGVHLVEIEPEP